MKLLGEHGRQNAGQEDVEKIEERPDARDGGRVAMNRSGRKAIQSRRD